MVCGSVTKWSDKEAYCTTYFAMLTALKDMTGMIVFLLQALPDVVYLKTASTESPPVTYGQLGAYFVVYHVFDCRPRRSLYVSSCLSNAMQCRDVARIFIFGGLKPQAPFPSPSPPFLLPSLPLPSP